MREGEGQQSEAATEPEAGHQSYMADRPAHGIKQCWRSQSKLQRRGDVRTDRIGMRTIAAITFVRR